MSISPKPSSSMVATEQLIREGYLHCREVLPSQILSMLLDELATLECAIKDSTEKWRIGNNFSSTRSLLHNLHREDLKSVSSLLSQCFARSLLEHVTGDKMVLLTTSYADCRSGNPALQLHTDSDLYGSNLYRPNNPLAFRAIYYLDDVSQQNGAFLVIPGSHNSCHVRHHGENLDSGTLKSECREIPIRKGDLIIIDTRVIHGTGRHQDTRPRRVFAATYYPAWAKPIREYSE